ncbi:MAG TPA: hypothetical protein VK678_10625, partial [Bradyrhizobium sp.]|nr:hypothetical protein [Bradyrhizobium sp.]
AARKGHLQHRYDREANEFFISEVFTIKGFLGQHPAPGFCHFQTPPPLVASVLVIPDESPRRNPFALPHPCSFIHTIVLESSTLQVMESPRADLKTDFIRFNRRIKSGYRAWSMTLSVSTEADAVPPGRVAEYRKSLEEIWSKSLWSFMVPLGSVHPRPRLNFGMLPGPPRPPVQPTLAPPPPAIVERDARPDVTPPQDPVPETDVTARRSSVPLPRGREKLLLVLTVAGIVAIILVFILVMRNV